MTLGNAAAARVRLIVWCRNCGREVAPDPDQMAKQCGAEMSVLDWRERLLCSGSLIAQMCYFGNRCVISETAY
jgi:hypothetical protein